MLSGGGAATFYTPEAYQSDDLDFILQFAAATFPPNDAPLRELGFERKNKVGHYFHPAVPYTLGFSIGPLAVGEEVLTSWDTRFLEDQRLFILTPTDCIRDRLAAFIHWKDFSSLEQALAVAKNHPIEIGAIEAWWRAEGGARQFEIFAERLSS